MNRKLKKKPLSRKLDSELKKAVQQGEISQEEYFQAWGEIKGDEKERGNDRGDRKQ